MKLGLQIPDFTWPGGAEKLGPTLGTIARTADEAGFDSIGVMDHFFQIGNLGPPQHEMLEAYTTLGFLAAHTKRAKLMTIVTASTTGIPGSSPRPSPPSTSCPADGPGSASGRAGTRRRAAAWVCPSHR
jgi:hypothetical protein